MTAAREKCKQRLELKEIIRSLQHQGKKVVFTNGCFDILHPGHVRYLERARSEGDILVVALNSDSSVRRIKGEHRPVMAEQERAEVIAALACVDFVTLFEEVTPKEIIDDLIPDVLVKGGDWPVDQIVGRQTVEANQGRVLSLPFEQGYSTSRIIDRILQKSTFGG
jgi:rfaE bifunctional protein nucleotidyltransferase chain/domain